MHKPWSTNVSFQSVGLYSQIIARCRLAAQGLLHRAALFLHPLRIALYAVDRFVMPIEAKQQLGVEVEMVPDPSAQVRSWSPHTWSCDRTSSLLQRRLPFFCFSRRADTERLSQIDRASHTNRTFFLLISGTFLSQKHTPQRSVQATGVTTTTAPGRPP